METKELKIQIPEGYKIDQENSTFECIKFKKKALNYLDILRSYNNHYIDILTPNDMFTRKLTAITRLMFVAKYLNDNWIPNWSNVEERKYYLGLSTKQNLIYIDDSTICIESTIYFKSYELAEQAIKILGEGTIRQALSDNY